jgi:glucose 1-dehydrogenase
MDLSGKTALVTGAGRGIGKACALELAQRGADLVINDRPGSESLESTASEIRSTGRTCHAIPADVFSREGCEQLVRNAITAVHQIDIFISNPAYSRMIPFLEYPPDEFERTIAATLTSGFHMAQLVARYMVDTVHGGRIIFISSVQAERPYALSCAYGPAKAGLNLLMQTIAVELAPHGINVNAIEPGWIDTPGEHVTFTEEQIEKEGQKLPLGRLGQPHEIAKAAAFLASGDADYISGSVLAVDGLFRFQDCRERV